MSSRLPHLFRAAYNCPIIDNHAHALLKVDYKDSFPIEGIFAEASGDALTQDSPHTISCFRAAAQLAELLGLPKDATWEEVKVKRAEIDYQTLCKMCFDPTKIVGILLDDGLAGGDKVEDISWHGRFAKSGVWRIVRIETEAEEILKKIVSSITESFEDLADVHDRIYDAFTSKFEHRLKELATSLEERVAGFKSVVCYRTGLNVSPHHDIREIQYALVKAGVMYKQTGKLRLQYKALNDYVVRACLAVAQTTDKPVQFHTGLGDNDITLTLSSPAHLQPLIKAFPSAKFVILHGSYPFTREAGYLTAVYQNVFFDFGEVFPFVSGHGQREVVRQVLELSPTNKIMWSTDGHYWPETYYLATIQARKALYDVLSETVHSEELTESQAVDIIKKVLFTNANRIYGLGLEEPKDVEQDVN
ncbi:hypothetical protein AMATHDRAFT_41638 [Amanita thiersii Skay4041]|uniref:Amidohydrolase-related domain-containing protein n=1 Tax=Amanita thiersii Skay4041 TaxID=703135 RepID=A0A2A9NNI3_9AGAR|nr:hypothetical protein AMATHDRAFT_41638 [Amanita thiersii Skay4041]